MELNYGSQSLRSGPTSESSKPHSQHDTPFHEFIGWLQVPINTTPSQDIYMLAFHRFSFDFLQPPDGSAYMRRGTFDLIPSFCQGLPGDSALISAVTAVSLANFAAREHRPDVMEESRSSYVKSLSQLGHAMRQVKQAKKAEIVLASYMLWIYEVVSRTESNGPAMVHLIGTESIMRSIAAEGSDTLLGFALSGFGILSVNYALFRHLGFFQRPPDWLFEVVQQMDSSSVRNRLLKLCCEAAEVCAIIKETEYFIRTGEQPAHHHQILCKDAVLLDARFATWAREMEDSSPHLSCEMHAQRRRVAWVRNLFNQPGAPRNMRIPTDSSTFFEWKLYWTFRLNLNYCVIDLQSIAYGASAVETNNLGVASIQAITDVMHSMLTAVPHILGVQPPSALTLMPTELVQDGGQSDSDTQDSSWRPDPGSASSIVGLRGYHLFWPVFNLLKAFNRDAVRQSVGSEYGLWISLLLRFLWQDIGIAQAECYRNWFDQGLKTEFPTMY